jgi:hypothetical protein
MEVKKMIYLVGVSSKALLAYHKRYPSERPNLLLSYARRSKDSGKLIFNYRSLIDGLILDSGTYSLNSNPGKFADIITLPGYQAYLQQLGRHFDFYFNFDQDFSRKGFDVNLANQLQLEKAGLHPVPVVHDCYSNEIQYYINREYDLVSKTIKGN